MFIIHKSIIYRLQQCRSYLSYTTIPNTNMRKLSHFCIIITISYGNSRLHKLLRGQTLI